MLSQRARVLALWDGQCVGKKRFIKNLWDGQKKCTSGTDVHLRQVESLLNYFLIFLNVFLDLLDENVTFSICFLRGVLPRDFLKHQKVICRCQTKSSELSFSTLQKNERRAKKKKILFAFRYTEKKEWKGVKYWFNARLPRNVYVYDNTKKNLNIFNYLIT